MSRAEQQVAQKITDALQGRIAEWQAEIAAIDVLRAKQDRKEARYSLLLELIAAAQKEIQSAATRIEKAQGLVEVSK